MQQYWAGDSEAYDFVGVSQLAKAFHDSGIGARLDDTPDLEKGQERKHASVVSTQEQGQNGSVEGQNSRQRERESDEQKKRNPLDPLVHEKCDPCPL